MLSGQEEERDTEYRIQGWLVAKHFYHEGHEGHEEHEEMKRKNFVIFASFVAIL